MPQLALSCNATPTTDHCDLCGRALRASPGHRLCVADNLQPVCDDCGRQHAPALAALVHLASAAERVSRIHRYSVFPPLSALLDLASAAEKYTCAAEVPKRHAG